MKLPLASRIALPAVVALCCAVAGCQRTVELGKLAEPAVALKIRAALGGEDAGEEATVVSESTGWATLKGQLTYVGEPPEMPPFVVDKDQATCAPGGQAPKQQYLVVDPGTKGVANIVLFARKVSRVHESAEPTTDSVVFDQKICVFLTHVTAAMVGQSLDIRNSDNVSHNTNIGGQNSFNQMIPVGQSTLFPLRKEESSPAAVRCNIHPWMLAYVLPRKNGYFAVTAPDGTFEIPNLPAGEEIEIQVWHENAATPTHVLVVDTPEAEALDWSKKGRFNVTLEPDETREISVAIPAESFAG